MTMHLNEFTIEREGAIRTDSDILETAVEWNPINLAIKKRHGSVSDLPKPRGEKSRKRTKSSMVDHIGTESALLKAHDSEDAVVDPWCDPENPKVIIFDEILEASERIRGKVMKTPCTRSSMLSKELGMELYLKKEFLQTTGSFKERGGRNALEKLTEEQKRKGVIAASSGNHALGLSYHGHKLGISVTVMMPRGAPQVKIDKCRDYGATVLVDGKDVAEAKHVAMKRGAKTGCMYINGYDHPDILAGQGTIGLEIVEELGDIDAIVIPVGGGGLLAGAGLAIKTLVPNAWIIGVESENCPSYRRAWEVGRQVHVAPTGACFADGLAAPVVGCNSLETVLKHDILDKMITVSEHHVAAAMVRLLETEKSVVEGAGAVGLAALMFGYLPELKGKRVVAILSGGNVDMKKLAQAIELGLMMKECEI